MCGVWYLAIGAGTLRSCVIPNKRTNKYVSMGVSVQVVQGGIIG